MADIYQSQMSILEQIQRIDPNGNPAKIVEVLNKTNPIFTEASAQMCNDTRSHVTAIRQSLGDPINPRMINAGADFYSSDVKNVRDEVMLLEGRIRLDEQIVESSPSPDALRMSEIVAGFENLTQDFTNYFFYGVGGSPGTITGLAPRFGNLALPNVHDAGGTTADAVTSLYILQWGIPTCNLVYPKNSMVGIQERDLGKKTVYDASSKPYEAYENIISLQMGLSVPDPRAVQRICNLETTGLTNNLADEAVWGQVIDAISLLPAMGQGAVAYVNRTTYAQIQKMAFNKTNAAFTYEEVGGRIILFMFGVPVRMMEGISVQESLVA